MNELQERARGVKGKLVSEDEDRELAGRGCSSQCPPGASGGSGLPSELPRLRSPCDPARLSVPSAVCPSGLHDRFLISCSDLEKTRFILRVELYRLETQQVHTGLETAWQPPP